jgi:uncharacterized protein YciU (UPF0263 family)
VNKFYGTITHTFEDKEYRLVLDFNAICHFEDETGSNFFERAEAWQTKGEAPTAKELRAVIHASLSEHHPDATKQLAGRMLSDSMAVFADLILAAMKGVEAAPAGKKTRAAG